MEGWTEGIQNAISYVEANLTGQLDIREIAGRACVSPFYFQRMFSSLCGISVGEYIRSRRLTLAGEDLLTTDEKIIDIAAKYGYESPDSFNRAFRRFHGVTPSAARKAGASLRSFAPVKVRLVLEGGSMLEYRIEQKAEFKVVGLSRLFQPDTCLREIPEFWDEVLAQKERPVCGTYGVCCDREGREFEYLIADKFLPGQEIPAGCVAKTIPASTWAVFPCRGPLVQTLQGVNARIWSEWLPNCRSYRLAHNLNLEFYTPPTDNPEDYYCEIWIPVEPM